MCRSIRCRYRADINLEYKDQQKGSTKRIVNFTDKHFDNFETCHPENSTIAIVLSTAKGVGYLYIGRHINDMHPSDKLIWINGYHRVISLLVLARVEHWQRHHSVTVTSVCVI